MSMKHKTVKMALVPDIRKNYINSIETTRHLTKANRGCHIYLPSLYMDIKGFNIGDTVNIKITKGQKVVK